LGGRKAIWPVKMPLPVDAKRLLLKQMDEAAKGQLGNLLENGR